MIGWQDRVSLGFGMEETEAGTLNPAVDLIVVGIALLVMSNRGPKTSE